MGGFSGGCQCGAVRYRADAPPMGVNICHCRMCQKATGSPFGAFAAFANDVLTFTGPLKAFRSSEIAERGFCGGCGTPLTYRGLASNHTSVTLGSLDEPNAFAPTSQLDADNAIVWLRECLSQPNTQIADWLASKHLAEAGSRQHPDHD